MSQENEPVARRRIRTRLAALGYRDEQIEEEQARYPEQQKALGGKRPDFLLYSDDRRTPLAVIEAKKQDSTKHSTTIFKAIKQGLNYASKLGSNIVFASDGNIVMTAHASNTQPLRINGEEVSDFLPEQQLLNYFEKSNNWDRGEEFSTSGALIKVFQSARKKLNNEGITKIEAFNEFAKLIFVKILTELRDEEDDMFREVPADWSKLEKLAGDALRTEYNLTLKKLKLKYGDIFQETTIKEPSTLESLVSMIARRSFIGTDADIKGNAYEYFLRDYTKDKDELNRYFTPRHIVKMMVKLANPTSDETVYDPFCGTGGMLIETYKHIKNTFPPVSHADHSSLLKQLRRHALYGQDISDAANIATMNMILIGDGHTNIKRVDSLKNPPDKKHDVVITNIPFSTDKEGNCIRHCLQAVKNKPSGRALIIVPERIVCEKQHSFLRKEILKEWNVERVISLPQDVFAEYTNAKTSVLFFTRKEIDESTQTRISVYNIKNDGFEGKTRRVPSFNKPNDINRMFSEDLSPVCFDIIEPYFLFNNPDIFKYKPIKKFKLMKVGDLISEQRRLVIIRPGMICLELGIQAKEHRIIIKKRKPYNLVAKSGRKRYLISKGDLVIGLLHTQNGLIAYSDIDEDLHATATHRAFQIDEKKVDRSYLFWTLRSLLMRHKITDTTGRESFNVNAIINLQLPLPPLNTQKMLGNQLDEARQKIREAETYLKKSQEDFIEKEEKHFLSFYNKEL